MMKSCEGCEYEMNEAVTMQDNKVGLHYPTWSGKNQFGEHCVYPMSGRKHFFISMVDDSGKIQIGRW